MICPSSSSNVYQPRYLTQSSRLAKRGLTIHLVGI